ncbi:MAG: NADH:flavin oxidoreductase [Syntrophus sp. (in: bacteria)]|nr:NADH:flavin oxidoreductase [Syntrophus sp. (in: bacteria)]
MLTLFEPTQIRNLTLANRFVRSATWEGLAGDNGSITPRLVDTANELARGGIGLIITGHAFVSREGRAGRWQLGIYSDDLIPGLVKMTTSVHGLGGKIAAQLAHAGSHAPYSLSGLEPMGPSAPPTGSEAVGREMTHPDIEAVIHAFAAAALRSQTAGFDAVQIHAAHGYLLSQFLSPHFNKRKDKYGGNIENRARLAVEVIKAVRSAVGPDFPVFIKVNSEDFLPGGLTVEEMAQTAIMLEKNGVDGIEMSGGTFLSGKNIPSRPGKPGHGKPEVYYENAARLYKEKVRVPLMLVGGIRTFETAERLVTEGLADYLAFCRPLIREPGLVNRWKSGDRKPAMCVSDNGCFKPGFKGHGVSCVVAARENVNRE